MSSFYGFMHTHKKNPAINSVQIRDYNKILNSKNEKKKYDYTIKYYGDSFSP